MSLPDHHPDAVRAMLKPLRSWLTHAGYGHRRLTEARLALDLFEEAVSSSSVEDPTPLRADGFPELTEAEVLAAIDAASQTVPCTRCDAASGEECRLPAWDAQPGVIHLQRKALAVTHARRAKGSTA